MCTVVNIKKISTKHGYIWCFDYIVNSGKDIDRVSILTKIQLQLN